MQRSGGKLPMSVTDVTSETLPEESKKRGRKKQPQPEQEIDQKLGRGQKLTRDRRAELVEVIRKGLIGGMHPLQLVQACVTQFKLHRQTVEKYLNIVRAEHLKNVGYYREQIQEICQKALVDIVKRAPDKRNDGAVVRAVHMLDSIFDIRVTPEDTSQAQRMFADEAIQKMDRMSLQQLQEFSEQLRQGGDKLTPEMLLLTPAEMEDAPKKRKKNKRHAADT